MLLTSHFGGKAGGSATPLTATQWGRLRAWLREREVQPSELLANPIEDVLRDWTEPRVSADHIAQLLRRGTALAVAMDKWQRAGVWVASSEDENYPAVLGDRLGHAAPPLFYGVGDPQLLAQDGVAIVGSRDASEDALAYAFAMGEAVAQGGKNVVSGAARGVDAIAMSGALESGGTAIGVLGNGLLRAATSSENREFLTRGDLTLISPWHPEAGFNAGHLMQRNKYIYCLASAAIVVESQTTGGTWNGALECLANKWVPLWVRRADAPAGNARIVKKGARWLGAQPGEIDISELSVEETPDPDLLSYSETSMPVERNAPQTPEPTVRNPETPAGPQPEELRSMSYYDFTLNKLEALCGEEPQSSAALVDHLDIGKTQLNAWLKRAVSEGYLVKTKAPVRYHWVSQRQPDLPL